jgi:uncharacterized membrane protein YkoI
MTRRRKGIAAAAAIAVLGAGGAAIAVATGGGDDDATEKPITGSALDRASEAALEHTGGGRVTDTEVGDEEGYYEVEVTREDGGQVDVHLNRDFSVTSEQADDDSAEDDD